MVGAEQTAILLEIFDRFEGSHPRDRPHYYLSLLGTHNDHRGKGIGMGLLADNLAAIDAEGMPAYLESTNPANHARYERLGFVQVGEFSLPSDGPQVATMWREASAAPVELGAARRAAIALLPGVAAIVVPALILLLGEAPDPGWGLGGLGPSLPVLAGAAMIAAGLAMWAWTVRLFARVGRGTLAPWDPTRELVVEGPYRHVRNPMISAVLGVLLGEAALLGSVGIAVWAAAFAAVNTVWFVLGEEPGPGAPLRCRVPRATRAARAAAGSRRRRPWEPAPHEGRWPQSSSEA